MRLMETKTRTYGCPLEGLVVVVVVAGGVKIPGKAGTDGVVGVVVGKGKNGIPEEGVEPNGGKVDNGGVWSVGMGKLPPMLGSPGMFKRRRLAAAWMLV
ncbi:hypothetical protein L1987_85426 [Smallanthus sonchifolius]|uniref:Uncharacterized protein n=1 Tax=Smallanthus sonchifolius TaxID=185202 RepID=A0ACB8Y0N4_9ASTR|nr:hypothetical protein L1987_85426 [Smallanthus sonchifolius]